MDERNESRLAPSLVNGRLEGISVPDLVWNVCRRKATGVLHLTAGGITKKVYIDQGRIVFAASGDPNERLGEMLLRDGVITLDQLENAIVKLASGKRLGTILVEAGHLSPENLVRGVLGQVRGIVLGLFSWRDGEYSFHEGALPTEELVTLSMRTAEILLQGIRQIRSFTRVRRSVGTPATRFRLDPEWRATLDGLEIRDGERMLLQRIDEGGGRGISIERLCREVFLSNYEIYQALLAFKILGIVEEVERASEVALGAVLEGRLARVSLPDILVRLSRDGETGVLFLAQGGVERSFHIKEGICVFATSNAIDDGLIAHLLRRGVISLRDREETARRLLSNKRVGTILLEMGVIDESDLRATVREQLSEIVFDSFRWDDGDFQFSPGELPTVEDITLNRTVEDLVFAGVRRVTSWARVRDGCGGTNARLVLKAEYLAVLDKMSVGAEEWELISLLKQPRSVAEVCRQSVLGDFRSCQILWALRLLGAIGEAPLEQSVDAALGALDARTAATPPSVEAVMPGGAREMPVVVPSVIEGVPFEVVAHEPAPSNSDAAPTDRPGIEVSAADETTEIISEPWRLAGERRPDDRPAATPAIFAMDTAADETLELSREEVDAAVQGATPGGEAPRFELGEPGSGLEDMNVDMPPAAPTRAFEMADPSDSYPTGPADFADSSEGFDHPPEPVLESVPETRDDPAEAAAVDPVEPESVPTMSRPIDADQTSRISRDEIETALRGESFEEPKTADGPVPEPWTGPVDLDGLIAGFNARHAVLFRALRAEVGAGAANFVRSCRSALGDGLGAVFASADLRADGSWDPEGLKRAIVDHRAGNVADGMKSLLDQEVELLRVHLGEKRVSSIVEQLAAIS